LAEYREDGASGHRPRVRWLLGCRPRLLLETVAQLSWSVFGLRWKRFSQFRTKIDRRPINTRWLLVVAQAP